MPGLRKLCQDLIEFFGGERKTLVLSSSDTSVTGDIYKLCKYSHPISFPNEALYRQIMALLIKKRENKGLTVGGMRKSCCSSQGKSEPLV
jgi:hypothetical protein